MFQTQPIQYNAWIRSPISSPYNIYYVICIITPLNTGVFESRGREEAVYVKRKKMQQCIPHIPKMVFFSF